MNADTPIHHEQRRALAQQLRWLVGGRITNDRFDDLLYDENLEECPDTAVAEIAHWAWTLYSDTWPYKLTGLHAVNQTSRQQTIRAIVLLRSGEDYRWPRCRPGFLIDSLVQLRVLSLLLSLAFAIITASVWYHDVKWIHDQLLWPLLMVVSLCLIGLGIACHALSRRLLAQMRRAFEKHGDWSCWPFNSEEQLAAAASRGHLLAK